MTRAWKHCVYTVPPTELDARLNSLAAQLGATIDEAKGVVRRAPTIARLHPATVGLHFSQLRQPSLLTYSYSSQVQAAKWAFLTYVLQLSLDDLAAKPHLLMSSLPNKPGPRWEYLQQLSLHGLLAPVDAHHVIGSLTDMTDIQCRAKYTAPRLSQYDENFQQQWQNRWKILLVDLHLSIQDIVDQPDLLQIPLKNT